MDLKQLMTKDKIQKDTLFGEKKMLIYTRWKKVPLFNMLPIQSIGDNIENKQMNKINKSI